MRACALHPIMSMFCRIAALTQRVGANLNAMLMFTWVYSEDTGSSMHQQQQQTLSPAQLQCTAHAQRLCPCGQEDAGLSEPCVTNCYWPLQCSCEAGNHSWRALLSFHRRDSCQAVLFLLPMNALSIRGLLEQNSLF